MRTVIFDKGGKLVLGHYEWFRNSECFIVGYGTTKHTERHYQDLNYEIVADINYPREYIGGFFVYKYPKNNTLNVLLRKPIAINPDMIKKMKGFKKYFGHCNIETIKIEHSEKF